MTESILPIILAIIGSSGVASIVVAILNHHWSRKATCDKRIDALVTAQRVLMIDRIRHLGRSYINQDYISIQDKENLLAMYAAYKALGGNGHLNTIMDEVNKLDVRG